MFWGESEGGLVPHRVWRSICALLTLVLPAALAPSAHAETAVGTGSAQAVIVAPLSLVKVQDLDFGLIAATTSPGTVTVDPNSGACSVTGTIASAGTCQFAEFAGMGVRRLTFRIQIPTTVTLSGPGGASMVANTFTLGLAPDVTYIGGNGNGLGNGNRRYQINSNTGIFTFRMGGRLNVGANQAPGIYNGSFNVTVQYQ